MRAAIEQRTLLGRALDPAECQRSEIDGPPLLLVSDAAGYVTGC